MGKGISNCSLTSIRSMMKKKQLELKYETLFLLEKTKSEQIVEFNTTLLLY